MKNEKFWNGFILGYFIGGIVTIILIELCKKGII